MNKYFDESIIKIIKGKIDQSFSQSVSKLSFLMAISTILIIS